MEERLRFVVRLLEGEAMSDLAREFGISRKTGYKILNRYREHGLEALCDRSRRPWRYANQLPLQVESLIVGAKKERPHWGARKIRELLVKRLARVAEDALARYQVCQTQSRNRQNTGAADDAAEVCSTDKGGHGGL